MYDGDRGIVAALAGCLALAALGLWDHSQQQKPEIYCPEAGNPADCRPQQYASERAFIPSNFERAISNPEPTSGQDHEKRDLAAQEASAAFAFWMAVFAGFGTIVTTLATILLYQQIKLTREAVTDTGNATKAMMESNEIARNSHKIQQRPWVSLAGSRTTPLGHGKLEGKDFIEGLGFYVNLMNTGVSPAMRAQIVSHGIIVGRDDEPPHHDITYGDGAPSVLMPNIPGSSIAYVIVDGDLKRFYNYETSVIYHVGVLFESFLDQGTKLETRICLRIQFDGWEVLPNGQVRPGVKVMAVGPQNYMT